MRKYLRGQDEVGRRSKKVKPWLTWNQILIGCKIQQIETLIRNSIHIQRQRLAIGILDVCIRCEKGSFSIFVTLHWMDAQWSNTNLFFWKTRKINTNHFFWKTRKIMDLQFCYQFCNSDGTGKWSKDISCHRPGFYFIRDTCETNKNNWRRQNLSLWIRSNPNFFLKEPPSKNFTFFFQFQGTLAKCHFWTHAWNPKILLSERLLSKYYEDDIYKKYL